MLEKKWYVTNVKLQSSADIRKYFMKHDTAAQNMFWTFAVIHFPVINGRNNTVCPSFYSLTFSRLQDFVKNWPLFVVRHFSEPEFPLEVCPSFSFKVYVKYTSICIAHFYAKRLKCAQTWITQFYLQIHHACLYSPAAEHHRPLSGTHFTVSRRVEGRVDLGGWLYIPK